MTVSIPPFFYSESADHSQIAWLCNSTRGARSNWWRHLMLCPGQSTTACVAIVPYALQKPTEDYRNYSKSLS